MESKEQILNKQNNITSGMKGTNQVFGHHGILIAMEEYSQQQNAILIEKNRKLRTELETLIHLHKTYLIKNDHIERLEQTLKEMEDGEQPYNRITTETDMDRIRIQGE